MSIRGTTMVGCKETLLKINNNFLALYEFMLAISSTTLNFIVELDNADNYWH